jgi:hypothetical protein
LHRFHDAERRIVKQRLEQINHLQADGIRAIMADYTNHG